jgi:hypothetical protein
MGRAAVRNAVDKEGNYRPIRSLFTRRWMGDNGWLVRRRAMNALSSAMEIHILKRVFSSSMGATLDYAVTGQMRFRQFRQS